MASACVQWLPLGTLATRCQKFKVLSMIFRCVWVVCLVCRSPARHCPLSFPGWETPQSNQSNLQADPLVTYLGSCAAPSLDSMAWPLPSFPCLHIALLHCTTHSAGSGLGGQRTEM
ncbi:hypothetical protein BKA61DRAFT_624329 [Leptodontidium sp. MPI-SDFR-AT-0119]|nr:hypothetical protein BKA61DRAFT_624329 [Leptodontidium sp. MPI-SDFR-AT-0119]